MNIAPLIMAAALAFFHLAGEKLSAHFERFHIELILSY